MMVPAVEDAVLWFLFGSTVGGSAVLGIHLTKQHFCTEAFFTVDHLRSFTCNHSDTEIADQRTCSDRQVVEEIDAHDLEHFARKTLSSRCLHVAISMTFQRRTSYTWEDFSERTQRRLTICPHIISLAEQVSSPMMDVEKVELLERRFHDGDRLVTAHSDLSHSGRHPSSTRERAHQPRGREAQVSHRWQECGCQGARG